MRRFPRLSWINWIVFLALLAACAPAPAAPTPTEPPPSPTPTGATVNNTLTPALAAPTYLTLALETKTYAVYHRVDLTVATDGQFKNPFDTADANIQVAFTAPDGKQFVTRAFWYQDFDPANQKPLGQPRWLVRFTPTQTGEWTAQASLTQASLTQPALTSPAVRFGVGQAPTQPRGFVRVNPANPRYFAYDDGSFYFPTGINMGWGGGSDPLGDYRLWLDHLAANRGNFIRVWMASWSFGLEWTDTGLGDYTKRLYRAWMLDQVFRMTEDRGIEIELVLINHGAFSATTNPEWDNNPYNIKNGGPCAKPEDFATNLQAQSLFARRLEYIAARWSYSPALMAWEWWNEADLTPISTAQMKSWIAVMDPVLRAADPYHHLISTSYAGTPVPEIFNLPSIDFAQKHLYDSSDAAVAFKDVYTQMSADIPAKPLLFAEFGQSAQIEDKTSQDHFGLHLHNGLWAAAFSGFASTAMYWWWDSYVEPFNIWPAYARLGDYLQDEDLSLMAPAHASLSNHNLPVMALAKSDRLLVWIHDRKNDTPGLENAIMTLFIQGKKAGPDWVYTTAPVKGLTLTVYDLKDGPYTAYWYAPMQGEWTVKTPVQVSNGSAKIPVPDLTGDLALKLIPPGQIAPGQP